MANVEPSSLEALNRENRILERRLRRMESDIRQLEEFQDSNATLLSKLLEDLEAERAKSQRLLLNVLPERIIGRLEAGEAPIADRHDSVTVLFSDFVGFTRIAAGLSPRLLIEELNHLFSAFDAICKVTGVEQIKTIGDAYLAIGGLADESEHTRSIAETALQMTEFMAGPERAHSAWQIRIGIACGPVVAGVVGTSRFAYDVWGDTVNVASRLETTSEAGRIHVSAEVADRLRSGFLLESRGQVELKGKGLAETYFLVGRGPATA
jgi:class 3 adenylate cyclase